MKACVFSHPPTDPNPYLAVFVVVVVSGSAALLTLAHLPNLVRRHRTISDHSEVAECPWKNHTKPKRYTAKTFAGRPWTTGSETGLTLSPYPLSPERCSEAEMGFYCAGTSVSDYEGIFFSHPPSTLPSPLSQLYALANRN